MTLESISNASGLLNSTLNSPAAMNVGVENPLSAQSECLNAGAGNSLAVGELADRVEQLGPGSVSPEVHDALLRAGAIDPDIGGGVPMANDFSPETEIGTPNVPTAQETLSIRETQTEVQVVDSEGNVRTTVRPEEYAILKNAGLSPQMVNDRVCFVREDIDPSYKDAMGRTNAQRMEQGLSPLDSATGQSIELHHVGQSENGALAELTMEEHRTAPNNIILHPNRNGSEVEHGNEWNQEKASHWKTRTDTMGVAT